jgi:class 3 adenylate cyclase
VSLPSGIVTFLLTDVEGSTQLHEQRADAMVAAMRRHQEIVAAAVAEHGGLRPEEQREGDSAVAAFVRPGDAVRRAPS